MHIKTTGWIALVGGMTGADIGVGWVDSAGALHFQDRYARNFSKPIIDSTTNDWIGLQGREENGWTAIQFKRLLETCDYMDVSIKTGTNIVIFAYGISDPDQRQSNGDISYHENRRGTRMIPLRSYDNPPPENTFDGLDSFDFRLNNYLLPSTDTTYYCKVFKIPSRFSTKRHAIGYKILVDPSSQDIVHHMTTYECNAAAEFDDAKLPEGVCDDHINQFSACLSNMANGWAVGGDHIVEYPEEVGYPVGGDFPVKYYMIQTHFDNAHLDSDRHDNSGIRFYIGEALRRYDLGYLTLGTESNPGAIVIPPQASEFVIDAFCTPKATEGGQKTTDEMCLQTFTYYPRMNDLFICVSSLSAAAWLTVANSSSLTNVEVFKQWLHSIQWTPEVVAKWQQFHKNSSRLVRIIGGSVFETESLDTVPIYQDLITMTSCNTANHRTETFIFLLFIPLLMSI
ncbi:unnamed protein product [Rotaria sp. Silwood2]|nr:unnamed protein product [Rotaria sp. Silwood2]